MRSLAPRAATAGLFHLRADSLRDCVVFGMHQSPRRSVVTLQKTFAGVAQLQFVERRLIDSTSSSAGAAQSPTISRSHAFFAKRTCQFTSRPTASSLHLATAVSKNSLSSPHGRSKSPASTRRIFGSPSSSAHPFLLSYSLVVSSC